MTTADWAFVISIFSAVLSLAGFIWNVWSKFIYPKPKVRTTFAVMNILSRDSKLSQPFLSLNATNYGPGAVTLYNAVASDSFSPWSKLTRRVLGGSRTYGVLNPLSNFPDLTLTDGPFGSVLPKKLDVGETFSARFVFDHFGLRDGNFDHVGFSDTFGRNHWAPKSQVRKVLARIKEEFPEASAKDGSSGGR